MIVSETEGSYAMITSPHTGTVDACYSMSLVKQTQNKPIEDASLRKISRNLNEGKMLMETSCLTLQTR